MTQNEITLLNIIRQHNNPAQALFIAIEIITNYIKQIKN